MNSKKFNEEKLKKLIKNRIFSLSYLLFKQFIEKEKIYSIKKSLTPLYFIEHRAFSFFINLAKFIIKNKVINPEFFIKYLFSSKKLLIKFEKNKNNIYNEYLEELFFLENPEDGFERSVKFIEKWAEKNNFAPSDFFDKISEEFLIFNIDNKNLSPWLFFSSVKARNFLLNIDDLKFLPLLKYFDMKKWELKLKIYKNELEKFKEIIKQMGL